MYARNHIFVTYSVYFVVQFIKDNVKTTVTEGEINFKDDTTCAMYQDKKYYPCVVLSESGKITLLSL